MGDDADSGDGEVDPAELQRQLADIKGAMGLEDRYPGQRRMWPIYGASIAAALILLNATFTGTATSILPDWAYFWLFVAVVVGAGIVQWRFATRASAASESAPGPDFRVLFATLVFGVVAFVVLSYPSIEHAMASLPSREAARLEGATTYGTVVVIAGLGFLFTGNALQAYRIRKRDRYVFYGAGAWMLVYGAIMPQFEILGAIGYGLFGVLFFAYSLVAYVVLGRSDEDT